MKARARGNWHWPFLYDHLGDKDRAIALCEPFMQNVIADLDNDWTLTEAQIERAITEMNS